MSGNKHLQKQYQKYDIKRKHDNPDNSRDKYPPDWNYRQAGVLNYHNETCARCRRPVGSSGNVLQFHIHHVIPLHKRGGHELENLVPLCEPCHSLMHPDNHKLGEWSQSPLFPSSTADPRVAVEREPLNDFERAVYDDRSQEGQETETGDVNVYARSEATTEMPAHVAINKQNPTSKDKEELDVNGKFDFFCSDCNRRINYGEGKCESCTAAISGVSTPIIVGGILLAILLVLSIIFIL